jgi:hypothetical protein
MSHNKTTARRVVEKILYREQCKPALEVGEEITARRAV